MYSLMRGMALVFAMLVCTPAFAADPLAISSGTVKKVDKDHHTITLTHGPLDNLGMPGMTMAFKVKNAAWLDTFKPGQAVRFRVEELKDGYTIVRIEAGP